MTELIIAVLTMAACVYGASSASKLTSSRNYRAFRDGLAQTGLVRAHLLRGVAAVLAAGEATVTVLLATAAVLAAAGTPGSVPFAAIALGCGIALTGVLAAGVARVIRSGTRAICACFGARSGQEISGSHLVRNIALLLVLIAGLIGNVLRHGRPAPAAVIVVLAAGAVIGLLLVRFDDLVELFAPVRESR
jgi:methylamine utilization protein MauE